MKAKTIPTVGKVHMENSKVLITDRTHGERMSPFVFLDFDGVLHTTDGQRFARLAVLIDALEGMRCEIVVSSSWRHHMEIVEIAAHLGALAPRVIGVTPSVSFRPQGSESPRFIRQVEVERWLDMHAPEENVPFIVLDDDASSFEPGWAPLLLVDPANGLAQAEGRRIRHWLRGLG